MIIHDIPTWCNITFNTNLVTIYLNVEVPKNKPVYFLHLMHLIAMTPKFALSQIKRNLNMSNTFNNEVIIPLFVFLILAVRSIMARNVNQSIVSFIDVGQYESLSWGLNLFFIRRFIQVSINVFSYSAASGLSVHSWSNAGWFIYI